MYTAQKIHFFPEMIFSIANRYYPTTGKAHRHALSDTAVQGHPQGGQSEANGPASLQERRMPPCRSRIEPQL
jgi:hypothetical protein